MSSAEADGRAAVYSELLTVAKRSIEHGLRTGERLPIELADFDSELRVKRATFVTLHRQQKLRGCVGCLEARDPLVVDVARSAFAAAFRDSRFPALNADELSGLEIHISILSPLIPFPVEDEEDLLRRIRPGVDGIVLRDGSRQGTFLPAVWENLRDPRDFLFELKRKAELPTDAWSQRWEVWRFTTESIP